MGTNMGSQTVKGLLRVRYMLKPWCEGNAECAACERRSLIETCSKGCPVIEGYRLRKGLLFIKGENHEKPHLPA